jgi:predicted dehydrogenase
MFSLVPRHVMGGPGQIPPSERLDIGFIAAGGRANGNINSLHEHKQNIVALCDADWARAGEAFKRFPQATRYQDFRKMLDKEGRGIDAVVVSTPDHLHAVAAIRAMKMGKHVYCEKPLTHSIFEAREMARVAHVHKVATQMGNGGQAGNSVRVVAEMIADGWIGRVREVHRWTNRPIWPQGIERPREAPSVPNTLNWDLWVGPAPMRPYHPAYVPFKWRGWWDFGTGALGDMGCHYFHPIFVALDLGHPESVEAESSPVNSETYPSSSKVTYVFPAKGERSAVKLVWYDGGRLPQRPAILEPTQQLEAGGGVYYSGDRGTIFNGRLIPVAKMREAGKPTRRLARSPGHYAEWINACKGGAPAGSNFDMAAMVTQTVLLGNIALRTGRKLRWDADTMRITNVPEANQHLHRRYREGWTL